MMKEKKYISEIAREALPDKWEGVGESPSNIALIKYWGKKQVQIPTNPSLSFTLNESKTNTTLHLSKKEKKGFSFQVFFEGEESQSFRPKIEKFLNVILPFSSWLDQYHLSIHTQNTFPHSSGIASSASGMSALAKLIVDFETSISSAPLAAQQEKASFLARLGSGSACRSVYKGLVSWGKHTDLPNSSNLYASPLGLDVAPVFRNFQDSILLIHEGQKTVSSSVGHQLMEGHPYAERRFESANENLSDLLTALKEGDVERFGQIVEHEALALHAMMMTSEPAFILMQPQTVSVLHAIWNKRKLDGLPVYFTLDAGANVHVLYPEYAKAKVRTFIKEELLSFTEKGGVIHDFTD